jgi:S-adenosylmethionine:tRNA-ribosyltransferase-isomerase (queuine synthetase)
VNIDTFKPITERYLEDHKIHKENYHSSVWSFGNQPSYFGC